MTSIFPFLVVLVHLTYFFACYTTRIHIFTCVQTTPARPLIRHVSSFRSRISSLRPILQVFLVGQSSFWIKTVLEYGLPWVLYPALLVIVNDTMAYVFGLTLGSHKLLPRLSPKKTLEGFTGALVSTVGISVPLLRLILGKSIAEGEEKLYVRLALTLGAFISLVSPFGGFLASAVKRAHGAKDFGTLIPGHGGVVDRFDCQIVTAPFVYLLLKFFGATSA